MRYLLTIGWVALALMDYSICSLASYSGSTAAILQSSAASSHEEQIQRLSTHIRSRPISSRIVLQRSPAVSHGVRPHGYKQDCFQIDISSFNQPLSIQSIPLSDVPSSWHGCIDFNRSGGRCTGYVGYGGAGRLSPAIWPIAYCLLLLCMHVCMYGYRRIYPRARCRELFFPLRPLPQCCVGDRSGAVRWDGAGVQ